MNHAIRTLRRADPPPPSDFLTPLRNCVGRKASSVKLRLLVTTSADQKPTDPQNMEASQKKDPRNNPQEKKRDLMSDSFGEGYATRSEEEGFGGIYGGNRAIDEDDDDDKEVNENHSAYDKSQGSEVKEKEKARHQTDSSK